MADNSEMKKGTAQGLEGNVPKEVMTVLNFAVTSLTAGMFVKHAPAMANTVQNGINNVVRPTTPATTSPFSIPRPGGQGGF